MQVRTKVGVSIFIGLGVLYAIGIPLYILGIAVFMAFGISISSLAYSEITERSMLGEALSQEELDWWFSREAQHERGLSPSRITLDKLALFDHMGIGLRRVWEELSTCKAALLTLLAIAVFGTVAVCYLSWVIVTHP